VLPRQAEAHVIGGGAYHSSSGAPARAFTARAMVKSRSERRFT
jgi:hypothetical protein